MTDRRQRQRESREEKKREEERRKRIRAAWTRAARFGILALLIIGVFYLFNVLSKREPELPAAYRAFRQLPVACGAEAPPEITPQSFPDGPEDLGLDAPARDRFVRASYALLDLISLLTAGEDECRAWPIRRGTVARKAAGRIHSDIERGFIRAEVIAYHDFVELKSEARCREAGKLRLEGKDYVVQDGDIIHFRFAV